MAVLAFRSPEIAAVHFPGRFVHLKTGDASTLLRRPFCVARVIGDEVLVLYRVLGTGTAWMLARRPGDTLDVLGPLGTTFSVRADAKRSLLVGGGLGIAPLLGLAEVLPSPATGGGPIEALFGVRTAGDVYRPSLVEGIESLDVRLATDDGTEGFAGNAVELLAALLDELAAEGVAPGEMAAYAAGPEPMLAATARLAAARGLDLQVSLEAHMACGMGACRACGIVRWADESRINGRVCKEGPVFRAADILWEEPA